MTTELVRSAEVDQRIDALELAIIERLELIEPSLEHRFTPGLYIRTLRAPAGAVATTYIHRQEHPFVVTKGVVMVSQGDGNWVCVEAPYIGITKVGTRRICVVLEDAEWTTFHPIPEGMTDLEEIEKHLCDYRTLSDGTNVKDRFQAALAAQQLAGSRKELSL